MCQIFPSAMCPKGAYQQCDLNIMNFWYIICIYWQSFQDGLQGVLANLPILLLLSPTLPIVGFLYLMYLISLPFGDLINDIVPALAPSLVSIVGLILLGLSRFRALKLFIK